MLRIFQCRESTLKSAVDIDAIVTITRYRSNSDAFMRVGKVKTSDHADSGTNQHIFDMMLIASNSGIAHSQPYLCCINVALANVSAA